MMTVETLDMAKVKAKRGRPPGDGRGKPVRIAEDLVRMARVVSAETGVPMSEYVAGILRPVVTRDYKAAAKRMGEDK